MKSPLAVSIIIFVFFVAVGILVFHIFWSDRGIVNYPPRGTNIVAMGDSLTRGVGASRPERGYVSLLEERLGVTITNKGVSGDTTQDGLLRLDRDILAEHPDIVIVLLGGNDYLRRIPQEETFRNLRAIVTRIQASGAVVVLVGVRGGLFADKFEKSFAALAEETGSIYIPNILEDIIGETHLMADQIHPNDDGYRMIADRITPVLEELITAARTRGS